MNKIKERPILFSAPMVRALLNGSKTQTRRALKTQPDSLWDSCNKTKSGRFCFFNSKDPCFHGYLKNSYPHGNVGERLWVRETHYRFGHWEKVDGVKTKSGNQKWKFVEDTNEVLFDAPSEYRKGRHHKDPLTPAWHKRLARFMPKCFSRITLEITNIRVERLNDISEEDAFAEGIEVDPEPWDQTIAVKNYIDGSWIPKFGSDYETAGTQSFSTLWESINGTGSWEENPWVWVIEFKIVSEKK